MSLPIDPSLLLIPAASVVVVVCLLLQKVRERLASRALSATDRDAHHARHCLYCLWGKAYLRDEVTTYEGGEMVETRCYACANCGLPQWVVTRTSVGQKAS